MKHTERKKAEKLNAHCPSESLERISSSDCLTTVAFLGGIRCASTEADVKAYAEQFGEVYSVFYPISRHNGLPRGFAKVHFTQPSYLENFLRSKPHTLHEAEINVSEWVPKSEYVSKKEKPSKNKLFIKYDGLFDFDPLNSYFSKYGEVSSVDIKVNHATNIQRGIAFIVYKLSSSALAALKDGDTHSIEGRPIRIQPSKSMEEINNEANPWYNQKYYLARYNFYITEELLNFHKEILGGHLETKFMQENKALLAALRRPGKKISEITKKNDLRRLRWLKDNAFYSDSRNAGWCNHHVKPCSSGYVNREIVDTQHTLPNLFHRIDDPETEKKRIRIYY
jgi:RNA recognition motif. (a.k.a. RRM, RBD, or RNP domain)